MLLCFTAVALTAVRGKQVTADEARYLKVGQYLTSTWEWDMWLTTEHAPLSFYTHGLLLKPFAFPDDRARLFAARAVMLLYAWLLGFAVYTWARVAHGPPAGLLALGLWAALPDTLAHAPLITTDIILACWVTWLGFALWRWTATQRWRWAMVAGGCLGLALLSKYSAALWIPGCAGLLLVCARLWPAEGGTVRRAVAGAVLVFGLGYVVLCAGYGGRGMFRTWNSRPWGSAGLQQVAAHPQLGRLPILAPLPWWEGIDHGSSATDVGHPGFLMGRKFLRAPWYYLPVAFLFKMPTPFLALLVLVPMATRRVPAVDRRALVWLLVPPLVLTAYIMFAVRIAAGFRYMYPVLPALCVVLGRFAAPEVRLLPKTRRGVLVCVALCLAAAAWHYPNYLAYVNLFAGTPGNGYRIFADSTLDWGQEPVPPVALASTAGPAPIVNPGPVPVPGRLLLNVNTYQDVFSRADPHAWVRRLPVRRVHAGVWLEVDGTDAVTLAPPVLAAMARDDREAVARRVAEDADLPLHQRMTAYRWLALQDVAAGRREDAARLLGLARRLELVQAHGLEPDVAFGACLEFADAHPDDPVARNNAGVAAYLAGGVAQAAEHFAHAIRVQPLMQAAYGNLAILEGERSRWRRALEHQRTYEIVVQTTDARPFYTYRVYYEGERIMFGDTLELWPRYTIEQLEAEVAWHAQPSPDTGLARMAAYQAAQRHVEAGFALLDVERLAPGHPAVAQARADWAAAVAAMRRRGHVGV